MNSVTRVKVRPRGVSVGILTDARVVGVVDRVESENRFSSEDAGGTSGEGVLKGIGEGDHLAGWDCATTEELRESKGATSEGSGGVSEYSEVILLTLLGPR
jgi:hypothetical protein